MYIQFTHTFKKVLLWTLYGFFFLSPFLLYRGYLYAGTASRSVTLVFSVAIISIVLALGILFQKQKLFFFKSPIVLVSALYFLILLVSMFLSIDPSISFWSKATRMTGIFYLSHLAMLYLLSISLFMDRTIMRSIIQSFVFGATIFSVGYLIGPDGFKWIFADKPWDGFTFVNSSFAAMYLYAALLFWLWILFTTERGKRKWWQYFVAVLLVINPSFINPLVWRGDFSGGVMGESFASTYALIASLGALIVAWSISKINPPLFRKRTILVVVGLTVIVLASSTVSLISKEGIIQKFYKTQSSLARPIVWELSRNAIAERPLLGWGPENFEIAYQQHYNNSVLEERNGGEPWFDRAHNVIIDQLVDTGYIGTLLYLMVYLAVIGSMVFVVLKSTDRTDRVLATISMVYIVGHFVELQTAFDTSISYIPLVLTMASATVLLYRTQSTLSPRVTHKWISGRKLQIGIGVVLFVYFFWGFFWGVIPIMRAEHANKIVRTVGSTEKRLGIYKDLFGSPLDTSSFLWRTTTDFQRGISSNPEVLAHSQNITLFIKELDLFSEAYVTYVSKHPHDIRSAMSLADIYIYYRLFGVDKLNDAHLLLDQVIKQNPRIPQAYRMKAVAYLYQGKFADAQQWAQKALAVNPRIEETKRLVDYIDQSIREFPDIDLYFFKQI